MANEPQMTFGERFTMGLVSLLLVLFTLAFVALVLFSHGLEDGELWSHFLVASAILSAAGGVLGFVAGPARMAHHFGVTWGTAEPSRTQAIIVAVVVLSICAYVLFR
jgi:hypothetical protein